MAWESAYTADYIDLLVRLKEIITGQPLVSMPVRSGIGDGILYSLHTNPSGTPIETWAVTCTNDAVPATFSVVGSVTGATADATVGVPYINAALSFELLAGSVPFQVGNNFVFNTQVNPLVAAAQTWAVNRWIGTGARVINYLVSSTYDGTGAHNGEKALSENGGEWVSQNGAGVGAWWQVQFDKPLDIRKLSFGNYQNADFQSPNLAPAHFAVSYSDDGSIWTVDSDFSAIPTWLYGEIREYSTLGTGGAHKYWRITILAIQAAAYTTLRSLSLFTSDHAFNVGYYGDGYDAIFVGPGTAGGDNIFVGIRPDSYSLNGPNWIVSGSVGYSEFLDTFKQPKHCSEDFQTEIRIALYDQPMKYWIVVSGRGIAVFTRFQNITVGGFLGYMLQYSIPAAHQYPYPLVIAGSQVAGCIGGVPYYGWDRQDGAHRLLINPGTYYGLSWANVDVGESAVRVYTPGNVWKQASNVLNNDSWSSGNNSLVMHPYQTDEGKSFQGVGAQLDGQWPMAPIVIIDRQVQGSYGELEGIKHIPGVHAAEALITHEGDTWVILNNVHRVAENDFFALRLL